MSASLLIGLLAAAHPASMSPGNLRVDLREMDSSGVRRLSLRRFEDSAGNGWMLLCDPHRLETRLGMVRDWKATGRGTSAFDSSAWGRLHAQEMRSGWKDAGIRHVTTPEKGIVLSVDLCPSHKPLDRVLVRRLLDAFRREGAPVPVAFALSGAWIRTHGADLAWLQGEADSGRIDPTWVNHTDRHAYRKGLADRRNFLFLPGTDVLAEVLGAEAEMLRHGCVPSVFFRFPGLMDDSTLCVQVLATGLLPIGSDAWLAKSQNPRSGSIVLIHGNGNEPVGVHDFLKLLTKEQPEIRAGHWHLEDLSEELDDFPDSPRVVSPPPRAPQKNWRRQGD